MAITGHEQHGGLYSQEASRGRRRRRGLGPTTTEAPRVRGGRRTTTEAPRVRGGRRGGTTRGIPCDTKVKVVLLFCCALWFCAFVLLVQAQCLGRPWGGAPPVSKKSRGPSEFASESQSQKAPASKQPCGLVQFESLACFYYEIKSRETKVNELEKQIFKNHHARAQ